MHYITFYGNDGAGYSLAEYWEWYLSTHRHDTFTTSAIWKQTLSSDAAFDNDHELHLIYKRSNNFFHVILTKPLSTIRNVTNTMVLSSDVFYGSAEQCK